jgi:plasmid maintenance system killer protein
VSRVWVLAILILIDNSIDRHRLEKLSGDRIDFWSIRINDQWRICFKWDNGNAFSVEIVDYH